jgi:valyl-tRNA synthetase
LSDLLRLLHPFMPFITEEIWSFLGKSGRLITDRWPVSGDGAAAGQRASVSSPRGEGAQDQSTRAYAKIETVKEIVRAVRSIRKDAGAAPSRALPIFIKTDRELGSGTDTLIGKLANVSEVTVIGDDTAAPDDAVSAILTGLTVFVAADDLFDYEAERERLGKERDRLEGNIARLRGKLSNENFTSKAPVDVVNVERDKLAAEEDAYEKVVARLDAIAGK